MAVIRRGRRIRGHVPVLVHVLAPCVALLWLAAALRADDARSAEQAERGVRPWAYTAPAMPPVPPVKHAEQVRTPVDAFILHRLAAADLAMSPRAEKRTLIRRAFLDLIGLPPSPEEMELFLADTAPDAYERLLDRLLASPHYGERWGRHWLDVAGYADSNGILVDAPVPEIWKYRDYVIRSLNADKPYDRFLREQLAGDELVDWRSADEMTDEMVECLTATGFLRCTPDGTDNQDIYQVDKRWDRLHVAVEVAMKAVMGVNLNCARCHDHKFDPILQEEYYQVLGLFMAAYDPENWIPTNDFRNYGWPLRYVVRGGREEREQAQHRLRELAQSKKELPKERERIVDRYRERWLLQRAEAGEITLTGAECEALQIAEDAREESAERLAERVRAEHRVGEAQLKEAFPELEERLAAHDRRRKALQAERSRLEDLRILALWDLDPDPPTVRILNRGDFLDPGRAVTPGVPRVLDDGDEPFELPPPGPHSTRWRLALARWLTRPGHPLTARVIANRVWHYHFGRGIVATPDDFGSQGAAPTHPELLDWLAVWLVENDWSLKKLHKLIMMSHVYCQSSAVHPSGQQRDPDNRLLWRRESRRLEAEVIRDAMLAATGRLDRKMFGPPVPVKQADDGQFVVDQHHEGRFRRSVYLMQRRTAPVTLLEVFDLPVMDTNQPHRFTSTVPLQSLALLNNAFLTESAAALAERLSQDVPHDAAGRIGRAFEIVFGRGPDREERTLARQLVASADDEAAGWRLFCHGLLASNEFLYVD